jgi:hypothetical protein
VGLCGAGGQAGDGGVRRGAGFGGFPLVEHPECDLRAGWERFLGRVALFGEAASGAVLLALERSFTSGFAEQVARVGDLVDDVVDQVR